MPNHCVEAWRKAQACSLPSSWSNCDNVIIGGMGGSAIAGDLAADLAASRDTVPILVVRDLRLPFAIGHRTLFIACSYSGHTQETLSLFDDAVETGARVMVVSGGGQLSQAAESKGVPLLDVDLTVEPRSAAGYNLMLLLGVLQRLGLIPIVEEEVTVAVEKLSRKVASLNEGVPARDNVAKKLARDLRGKLVLLYGSGLFSGVARRWKSQLNENAKVWAFSEAVPEVLHDSVEAYSSPSPVTDDLMALVLQPAAALSGHARQHYAVAELLRLNNIPHRILRGEYGSPLADLLGMMILGDYVSYYLALLQGFDPAPTPSILAGKNLLANAPEAGSESDC